MKVNHALERETGLQNHLPSHFVSRDKTSGTGSVRQWPGFKRVGAAYWWAISGKTSFMIRTCITPINNDVVCLREIDRQQAKQVLNTKSKYATEIVIQFMQGGNDIIVNNDTKVNNNTPNM